MTDTATASTTDPTRVCHLVQDVSFGGVESLLADLATETPDAFDHHVCYVSDHDSGAEALRDAGASVTKLDIPHDSPRCCFDPRSYRPVVSYLRKHDIDAVHTHYPLYVHILGRIASAFADVEQVCGSYHNPRGDFHPVMSVGEFGTRVLTDEAVGVSRAVEESFHTALGSQLPGFATTGAVYNGVPVESFAADVEAADSAAIREAHGISEDALVFVSVGRYDRQKRQQDLVRAAANLDLDRDWHLLLVGHGPLETRLRDTAAAYDLQSNVTVTGRVDSVAGYYGAGDVFVSSSAYEGFGIVFVEAMAARLPVVATAVPGTSEVVAAGETGVLVPAHTPAALADAMATFTDPERRARFGDRGYSRALEEFDITNTAEEYAALYRGD